MSRVARWPQGDELFDKLGHSKMKRSAQGRSKMNRLARGQDDMNEIG